MPKKRKYQRGGSTSTSTPASTSTSPSPSKKGTDGAITKWLKKNWPYLILLAIVIVALAIFIDKIIDDDSNSSQTTTLPNKTMRQVLVDCGDIDLGDIDRVKANTCIQNYLQQNKETITSYQDLYNSNFFKGLTDWIKDEKVSLLRDEVVNVPQKKVAAMNQLVKSIKDYNVGRTILCQEGSPIQSCRGYDPNARTNDWEAGAISSVLENLHQCMDSQVCDNIIEEGGLDEHGREGGTPQKDLIESAFLYEMS